MKTGNVLKNKNVKSKTQKRVDHTESLAIAIAKPIAIVRMCEMIFEHTYDEVIGVAEMSANELFDCWHNVVEEEIGKARRKLAAKKARK